MYSRTGVNDPNRGLEFSIIDFALLPKFITSKYIKLHTVYIFTLGLCSEHGKVNTKIVLAGDHKQLDAVTKSKYATKLGFKMSWMEYLMKSKKCYTRHPITKRYDPDCIIVLTKNYRSHPAILHVPNQLFYDGTLEAKGDKGMYIHDYLKKKANF